MSPAVGYHGHTSHTANHHPLSLILEHHPRNTQNIAPLKHIPSRPPTPAPIPTLYSSPRRARRGASINRTLFRSPSAQAHNPFHNGSSMTTHRTALQITKPIYFSHLYIILAHGATTLPTAQSNHVPLRSPGARVLGIRIVTHHQSASSADLKRSVRSSVWRSELV